MSFMRTHFRFIYWMLPFVGGMSAPGCGENHLGEVGFVLIRLEELEGGGLQSRGVGLDRTQVVEATCEILKSDRTLVAGETFDVNPQTPPGEQEVRLQGVRAGSGYYARILGLDANQEVYECGVTGPLTIKGGKKHWVEIVIATPFEGDPNCNELCSSDDDCLAGAFCPSLFALEGNTECVQEGNCTQALCKPYSVGAACENTYDCGPLGCISPGYGYPGGYCMKSCTADVDCPGGQIWSSSCCPANIAGLPNSVCTRDCQSDSDCREEEGYICKSIDVEKYGCLPR